MGYDISDFIPCEICEAKAADTHHIDSRGMGGTSRPDEIENLMALCRDHHEQYGDIETLKGSLYHIHFLRMKERGVKLNIEFIRNNSYCSHLEIGNPGV